MTPLNLQQALKATLEQVAKLQLTAQHDGGFNIFLQNPPPKSSKDDTIFPFICIELGDGEQSGSEATQEIIMTIGVKDTTTDYQGFQDVVTAIEELRRALMNNPVIGRRYRMKPSIRWIIPRDEDTYPYYFGAVIVSYELPMFTTPNEP